MSFTLIQGQGRPDLTGKLHFAEILPFLGILWLLTSTLGLNGAAIAWSLRSAVDAFAMFWAAGMSRRVVIAAIARPAALLFASEAVARFVGMNLVPALAVAVLIGLVAAWMAYAYCEDWRRLAVSQFDRARGLFGRVDPPCRTGPVGLGAFALAPCQRQTRVIAAVISIAMATYNGEKFLEQQLQSLSKQTRLPAELVVCDDASGDATVDIVTRFSKTAPFPVKLVVNEQRLGWRGNFLKAASLCTSEYIAFCDQDDIWLPEKLAVVQAHLEKDRPTLLQHGYRMIDSAGAVISGPLTYEHLERNAPWFH